MVNHAGVGDTESANNTYGRLNRFTLLASTTSILLGYEEILVGTLNVFSLIGSLASGKTSDLIGRRYTIVLAAVTFLIGALMMGLATAYWLLLFGRIVAGIGVGYALMIAPLYTAELSPAMSCGFLTSLPEVFITLGNNIIIRLRFRRSVTSIRRPRQ